MLIYSILSNKKNNLKFLGKSENNIDMIMTQLTELKKHAVSVDNLKTLKENIEDTYLENKLNDIYTVYSQFQENIKNNYIDENDSLTILKEQLDSTNMFDNTEIYIDEFVGFTKQEYDIIEKLLEKAYNVTISITSDELYKTKDASNDIFYTNKETISKILKIAKSNNIKIDEPIKKEEIYRFKNKELNHIEKNLYNFPYKKFNDDVTNLKLFLANNQYSEVENIARTIVKLVRDEGYRYRDIAIITKNIDTYSNLCKAIFNEYNIPVYIDEKRDLSQNILVKYLISILDVFSKNWTYDSVINYIKSGFTNISQEDIYLLENYALEWNIRGSSWYKQDWNFKDADEKGEEQIAHLNELRRNIVNPLVKLKNNLSGKKVQNKYLKIYINFLLKIE